MRGHNICFCWEIRKIIFKNYLFYPFLSVVLAYVPTFQRLDLHGRKNAIHDVKLLLSGALINSANLIFLLFIMISTIVEAQGVCSSAF